MERTPDQTPPADEEFLRTVSDGLAAPEAELLSRLHRFTTLRREQASRLRDAACAGDEPQVHAFLRECWEALDGLAREINVCMYHMLPESRLYPPMAMTRQCTFYVVRKILHEDPSTADHPVSRFIWDQTRASANEPYRRLSFLYHVSLFLPLPLPDGRLPGTDDLTPATRELIKPQDVEGCGAAEGIGSIIDWLSGFAARCYELLSEDRTMPGIE